MVANRGVMSKTCGNRGKARDMNGFTYIGLLFAIVLLGILMSTAGVVWDTEARRENEQQLLFVGAQYQQAISSYHAVLFNGQKQLPASIDDLLDDRRFPMPVHHLRRAYFDPMTNSRDWGFYRVGNGIAGVYSLAKEIPIKKSGFTPDFEGFESAKSYGEWKFVYREDLPTHR